MQDGTFAYVDALLSEIAVRHSNHKMIAQEVFPPMPVVKKEGRYYVFGKRHLKIMDDARAQGSAANKVGLDILGTQTFFVNGFALRDSVTDEDRQNFEGTAIDPEEDTVIALTDMLMLGLEERLATKLVATANYESGYSTTLTGTDQWSDFTNSTPLSDIDTGAQKIHSGGVAGPYSMAISKQSFDKLKRHPDVLEQVKYTSKDSVSKEILAELLGFRRVLVGEAVKNTAAESVTDALTYVWGKTAVIFTDPVAASVKQATFGRLIHDQLWGGEMFHVRRWEDPKLGEGGTWIEVETRYTTQFIAIDNLSDEDSVGGYLIAGAVA